MHQILESIYQNGLTTARPCSVRGSLKDKSDQSRLCHNQVDLSNLSPEFHKDALTSLVYQDKEGCWAIAMERHFIDGAPLELSTALMNSVVFVFELDNIVVNNSSTFCLRIRDMRLCRQQTQHEENVFFQEVTRITKSNYESIPKALFRAILVPYHLADIVKSIFKEILVIPCNAVEEILQEDPVELFLERKSAISKKIIGPNYLRGLELFQQLFPNIKKFGTHLTRLPMTYINYLDNRFIVTEYNQAYWRAARLSNLKPQQLNLLRCYSDILIFPENGNTVLVVFRPPMKAKIESIVNNFESLLKASTVIQQAYRCHVDRQALSFFRERRQKIEGAKKVMINHIKNNQFQQCAELATQTSKLEDEAKAEKNEFQKLGACQFRALKKGR